jgi:hypothetical protein
LADCSLRCGEHNTEQAHPAKRGPKEVCVFTSGGRYNLAARKKYLYGFDALTEATLGVVGLAMYVIGNTSADGNELRSRCNHRKPTTRREDFDDTFEADTPFAGQSAGNFVEPQKAVHLSGAKYLSAAIDGAIAVTSSQTTSDGP